MFKKFVKYALLVCVAYIFVVGYLGFGIRDDYFALTFPSWPFLINCFENCGYKILIALFANGILVGMLAFFIMCGVSFSLMFCRKSRKSFFDRKESTKT